MRRALPVVLVYWLVLVIGLVLYSTIRIDDLRLVAPLWAGALFGTLLGQVLALCNLRMWLVALAVLGVTFFGIPLTPTDLPGTQIFWMTLAPAAVFGALALADRWSLAAFWFPAVIWMLSILDGTDGKATPNSIAALLLGGLAFAFVAFLRAREIRRVAVWTAVAPLPLATASTAAVLREAPDTGVRRAAWTLLVSGGAFALTAWLAPQLWRLESFDNPPVAVASARPGPGASDRDALPCCEDQEYSKRARVKEYFDIGRGRDALSGREEQACITCGGEAGDIDGRPYPYGDDPIVGYGGYGGGIGGSGNDGAGGNGGGAGGNGGYGGTDGTGETAPSWRDPPVAPRDDYAPTPTPDRETPPVAMPEPLPDHLPMPEPTPRPYVETPPAPPVAAPTIERPDPPAVAATEPETVRPTPAPAPSAPPRAQQTAAAKQPQHPASTRTAPGVLRWLVLAIVLVLALQFMRYALRPLRRALLLRHLRRPFWEETVDQRVSNWWQLVLVGLRDAGYRTSSTETPNEFARRTGIDGVERCATILDRARHGIAVDAADLDEMAASADAAYHAARANTGMLARGASWVRWPLA